MGFSERIRTYTHIGMAVGTLLLLVGLGVNLLTKPEPTTIGVWLFLVGACLFGASFLWNRYTERRRDDPKYWRERAHEARAHAKRLADPASQRMLLEMSDDYEKLAKRAEERLFLSIKFH
jgi:hypothetical protein